MTVFSQSPLRSRINKIGEIGLVKPFKRTPRFFTIPIYWCPAHLLCRRAFTYIQHKITNTKRKNISYLSASRDLDVRVGHNKFSNLGVQCEPVHTVAHSENKNGGRWVHAVPCYFPTTAGGGGEVNPVWHAIVVTALALRPREYRAPSQFQGPFLPKSPSMHTIRSRWHGSSSPIKTNFAFSPNENIYVHQHEIHKLTLKIRRISLFKFSWRIRQVTSDSPVVGFGRFLPTSEPVLRRFFRAWNWSLKHTAPHQIKHTDLRQPGSPQAEECWEGTAVRPRPCPCRPPRYIPDHHRDKI